MKITVGEYLTRGGNKARVYATDGGGLYPVHGAVYTNCEWEQEKWTPNGCMHINGREAPWDLKTHTGWREALTPIFDVLNYPLRYVAMDAGGRWHAFVCKPEVINNGTEWRTVQADRVNLNHIVMPTPPVPWTETLTAREDCQ